jgi:predicted metal-dependent phosphoesterase TrpH
MKKFDLHTHTSFSDGSDTPQELFLKAQEVGLSGLSITDHDTVEAYYKLPKTDLKIGVGIEYSSFLNEESVHVLGYDFILDHTAIKRLCDKHIERRLKRNLEIIKNLKKLGLVIEESELYQRFDDRSVGRPHIAKLMVESGFTHSLETAFRDYLGEGKKAYAKGDTISVQETVDVIHEAKGKAFIAHPHIIKKQKIIQALKNINFDGLEVYYARYPRSDVAKWFDLAKTKKWLISGGSDYHGDMKIFNHLGSSWVDEELFDKIFEKPL